MVRQNKFPLLQPKGELANKSRGREDGLAGKGSRLMNKWRKMTFAHFEGKLFSTTMPIFSINHDFTFSNIRQSEKYIQENILHKTNEPIIIPVSTSFL